MMDVYDNTNEVLARHMCFDHSIRRFCFVYAAGPQPDPPPSQTPGPAPSPAPSQPGSCFNILQFTSVPTTGNAAILNGSMFGIPVSATVQLSGGRVVCTPSSMRVTAGNVDVMGAVQSVWPQAGLAVSWLRGVSLPSLESRSYQSSLIVAGSALSGTRAGFKAALSTDGLQLVAVGIPGTETLSTVLANMRMSNVPTELANNLNLDRPVLAYAPKSSGMTSTR
jgi:hypothetical protein